MRQPKYEIGTILYNAYTFNDVDRNKFQNLLHFFAGSAIAIITNINIDRNDITYTLKEYRPSKEKDKWFKHTIKHKESSEDSKCFSTSYSEIITYLVNSYGEIFTNLTREMNKEKLFNVLHGE